MIGIFDSGVGGLSVLKQLRLSAPRAEVIYFGDSANAPYGNKTNQEIKLLTKLAIETLIKNGAHQIISACNSMSVLIEPLILAELGVAKNNFIEMVGPTVIDFKQKYKDNQKILLLATEATLRSGIYQKSFDVQTYRQKSYLLQLTFHSSHIY